MHLRKVPRLASVVLTLGVLSSSANAVMMYWTTFPDGVILRANPDDPTIEILVQPGPFLGGFALDVFGGKMYWGKTRSVQRANLDGSSVEDLVTFSEGFVSGLALDVEANRMYWALIKDESPGKIQRANLEIPPGETPDNRTDIEDLVGLPSGSVPALPFGIALDLAREKLYWVEATPGDPATTRIRRANLDGSNDETLVNNTPGGGSIAIAVDPSGEKIYWTFCPFGVNPPCKIQRANLDGSNVQDLVTDKVSLLFGIALDLDAGKMYWTNLLGVIHRANLNGSQIEMVIGPSVVYHPSVLALAPSRCGDGVVDPGEQCDDGGTVNCDGCDADCVVEVCGNGVVQCGEQCDDGYTDACGSCNANCSGPGDGSTCGDGELCPETEECDDGYPDACGSCNANCSGPGAGSTCGDGELCPETEECDDGYADTCGSCNADCTGAGEGLGACGDGNLCAENNEECDDGNTDPGDGCSDTCTCEIICGNGVIEEPCEECDDGNTDDGDGCSSTCTVAPGSKCTGEPSVCITDIPTVSEWGMVVLTLLLITAGTLVLRKRLARVA